jgi:hypothetical protein
MGRRVCLALVGVAAVLAGLGIQSGQAQATSVAGRGIPGFHRNAVRGPLGDLSCTEPSSCVTAVWENAGDANAVALAEPSSLLAPVINSFRPFFGEVGRRVRIRGRDLLGATVTFNGTPSTLIKDTLTTIRTTVPVGATSGPIRVTTPGGTVSSLRSFTVS